jgi:hypothetical protein
MRGKARRDWVERVFASHPPMVLSREDGTTLRLTAYAYQFPQSIESEWDDWLQLLLEARTPEIRWRNSAPCMLTWELTGLADWFEQLLAGRQPPRSRSFVEPLLSFSVMPTDSGALAIRASLGLEFYPASILGEYADPHDIPVAVAAEDWGADEPDDNYLDFPLSGLDLPAIGSALRAMLATFPVRPAPDSPRRRSAQP